MTWDEMRELLEAVFGVRAQASGLALSLGGRTVRAGRIAVAGVEWLDLAVEVGEVARTDVGTALRSRPRLGAFVIEDGSLCLRHAAPLAALSRRMVSVLVGGLVAEAACLAPPAPVAPAVVEQLFSCLAA
jgi:hypothetical protein